MYISIISSISHTVHTISQPVTSETDSLVQHSTTTTAPIVNVPTVQLTLRPIMRKGKHRC